MGKRKRKSVKGSLIKGMSKKLPSSLLDNPIFEERLKEIMKGYSGIYALYKNKKLYYIGLTTDLHGRIKWHTKDRHAGKWDKFIIFRIKKINYLKDIETLVQNVIDTKGNRSKGNVPKDSDLNKILQEILKQHKKEIKLITKAIN